MAKFKITSPDGKRTAIIDGPDDPSDEELHELTQAAFGDSYKSNPIDSSGVRPQQPVNDPENELLSDIGSGTSEIAKGFAEGGASVLDHAADWVQSGLDALGNTDYGNGPGFGDALNTALGGNGENNLAGAVPAAADGLETLRGIGRFSGEAAATLPLAALRGGALAQGAAGGALLSDADNPLSFAVDVGLGAIGGKVGEKAFNAGAKALAPPAAPEELRTLLNAGVRVEPGQVARAVGGKANDRFAAWTDRATSSAFVGPKIVENRQQGFKDFARATISRALEPVGEQLPNDIPLGRRAVRWAGDKLSEKFDDLLPRLSVSGDEAFLNDLSTIRESAKTLAPEKARQLENTLRGYNRYWRDGVALDGSAIKEIDERLAERVSRFSKSALADDQDLGDAFQAVRDSLHELAARQNPEYAGELQAINKGWKGLVQVEKASANSKAQITPNGYSQAVKQSSDTVRRRGYARGQALNQDLADAGSEILPSQYPDSGTAGRRQQMNMGAVGKGALDMLRYQGASAVQPLMLREQYLYPRAAELLRLAGRGAPIAAPAAIESVRN